MQLEDIKKIYFVGIGGIGMSAIARYFNARGVEVFGYDKTSTLLTKKLEEEGIHIHYTEDINQIPKGIDLVVYTPAIPKEHKELVYFKENKFSIKKRAEVLGIISKGKGVKTIAIAGTHGKTSTTSILTHVLHTGGIKCTAFLGGIANNFESNYVEGDSEWIIVEADEFDRSFLQLSPTKAAILSVDADHLDIYGDLNNMKTAFVDFVKCIKKEGDLYINPSLPIDLPSNVTDEIKMTYLGQQKQPYAPYNIRVEEGFFVFDIKTSKEVITDIKFTLPGKHNIENATVAIAIATSLGVSSEAIKEALATFKGIKRRFDFVIKKMDKVYIDDYAHHPTELEAAIAATRALFPNKHVTGIFQPHLFTRTRDFAAGFAKALDKLDDILLMDIYPARELPIPNITSSTIGNMMVNQNLTLVSKKTLLKELQQRDVEVVLTLGAGDIDKFITPIKELIANGN